MLGMFPEKTLRTGASFVFVFRFLDYFPDPVDQAGETGFDYARIIQ